MDLIFALVTNYATKAKTAVELSLSKFFKRQYSSLFRAISGYFTSRKNQTNRDKLRSDARNNIKTINLYINLVKERMSLSLQE